MNDAAIAVLLDELVPEPRDAFGDWQDVLLRAQIATAGSLVVTRVGPPQLTGRRALISALVVFLLVVLFATPAFGLLRDLIGRTDVPFTGKTAPAPVKRSFFDLSAGAAPGLSPEAIASQTRKVATFYTGGKTIILYVAPNRKGGFCWDFSVAFGSCWSPDMRYNSPPADGDVNRALLVVSDDLGQHRGGPLYTREAGGTVIAPTAETILAEYEDGTSQRVPIIWVSHPIDAGFFFLGVPGAHERGGTRLAAIAAEDANGRVLSRLTFTYAALRRAPIRESR
jgi:hypothetical protein